MPQWVRLPSKWIEAGGLRAFRWKAEEGGRETAALLILAVIAHHSVDGIAKLTYEEMSGKAGISRAMVSAALDILEQREVIVRKVAGRGTFGLIAYDPASGWAKLPVKGLYSGGVVQAFQHLTLRHKNELVALKLYFLFAAMRDNDSNYAHISYDKIIERTGVSRDAIRSGISILASLGLVHIENAPSIGSFSGVSQAMYNRYRLTHLDSYKHAGTSGRAEIGASDIF
ncbi:hypothetical protein [Sphingomonas pseudosanguinis]|uniref:DNA-binding transcriptional ArsR family regulator n=1 Tax=Sphingomonas pseudosanguinis TaxID=413712 RepID=A0A7W6AFX0_9SPHN|nr:hypothetical protein [Sphingomonas pseudosanguinis]MBB3879851.1 DNA-binding transcriptional ArsR family regulator [Sphingomonas pseudosanguinis]MBN3536862.1 hypothetical protein [Sphingomonas pseudosanguinis]